MEVTVWVWVRVLVRVRFREWVKVWIRVRVWVRVKIKGVKRRGVKIYSLRGSRDLLLPDFLY